ncbi:glycosyltransferase family 9 protein [bacterium]|nr:glycosyltransferase family 9 protein [bacterium]
MTTPALKALRKHFPKVTLDFLVGKWAAPALSGNPSIDNLIIVDDDVFHQHQFGALWKLVRNLRAKSYNLAVIFQPSTLVHLLVRFAGVRHIAAPVGFSFGLVSFPSEWRDNRNRYVVEDFLDVTRAIGVTSEDTALEYLSDSDSQAQARTILKRYNLDQKNYLVIFPGGGRNPRDFVPQKKWPFDRYRDIVEKAVSQNIRVVLAGNAEDRSIASKLVLNKDVVNLAGKTSIPVTASIIEQARLVLTNDSAPLHLAMAVNCPVVVLFGPSNRLALLPTEGDFIALEADIPCAPCYDNEPFGKCTRHDCILSLNVETVWNGVCEGWRRWQK